MSEYTLENLSDTELEKFSIDLHNLQCKRRLQKERDKLKSYYNKYFVFAHEEYDCVYTSYIHIPVQTQDCDGLLAISQFSLGKYSSLIVETTYVSTEWIDKCVEITKEEFDTNLDKFVDSCKQYFKVNNNE